MEKEIVNAARALLRAHPGDEEQFWTAENEFYDLVGSFCRGRNSYRMPTDRFEIDVLVAAKAWAATEEQP